MSGPSVRIWPPPLNLKIMVKEYEQEVWCVHQGFFANQGLTMCMANHWPCTDNCPYRKPDKYKITVSSASTDDSR